MTPPNKSSLSTGAPSPNPARGSSLDALRVALAYAVAAAVWILLSDMAQDEYFENLVLCRDGGRRLIAWKNALQRDVADKVVGTLSSGEDITERKEAEQTRHRQAEELKRRNEELERFNRATVGRELDMIALKRQVNALAVRLGEDPPYDLGFAEGADSGGGGTHGA